MGRKLKEYQTSGVAVVSASFVVLFLFAITVAIFAIANFGLYKIDHRLFTGSAGPGFFTFVYYSFNAIVANHISELIPSGAISQTFWMMEAFSAMFLGLIFVSLMLSTRNKRQKEELDQAIEIISEKGRSVETFILDQYKFPSVDAALAELEKLKAGMVSFIYRISARL